MLNKVLILKTILYFITLVYFKTLQELYITNTYFVECNQNILKTLYLKYQQISINMVANCL